jgi:hypothetical protein
MRFFNRLSFQLKLLLSFVLIIALTTVVGYYERTGSWNGVERLFKRARMLWGQTFILGVFRLGDAFRNNTDG